MFQERREYPPPCSIKIVAAVKATGNDHLLLRYCVDLNVKQVSCESRRFSWRCRSTHVLKGFLSDFQTHSSQNNGRKKGQNRVDKKMMTRGCDASCQRSSMFYQSVHCVVAKVFLALQSILWWGNEFSFRPLRLSSSWLSFLMTPPLHVMPENAFGDSRREIKREEECFLSKPSSHSSSLLCVLWRGIDRHPVFVWPCLWQRKFFLGCCLRREFTSSSVVGSEFFAMLVLSHPVYHPVYHPQVKL